MKHMGYIYSLVNVSVLMQIYDGHTSYKHLHLTYRVSMNLWPLNKNGIHNNKNARCIWLERGQMMRFVFQTSKANNKTFKYFFYLQQVQCSASAAEWPLLAQCIHLLCCLNLTTSNYIIALFSFTFLFTIEILLCELFADQLKASSVRWPSFGQHFQKKIAKILRAFKS